MNIQNWWDIDSTDSIIKDKNNIDKIEAVLDEIYKFIEYKDNKYGSSVTNPLSIFSESDPYTLMKIRIDDKLSRIKNSTELQKNDVVDLIGYLLFICVHNDWNDFKDMMD